MRRPVAVVLWLAIVGLLTGNVVALRSVDTGPERPSGWDPRVAALVDFVEDERDLRFDHPVAVEFLPEAEYKQRLTTGEEELTAEDRREIELFEGQARALGLIRSDTSVLDDLNAISSEGTLAYYDPEEEKIVIRGTELTVNMRATIAHELTHALQDQVFDLEKDLPTDGAESFFQALVEGDATRIENAYVEDLSESEREEYFSEEDEGGTNPLENVAPALVQFFSAPYVLGEPLTNLIVEDGGQDALNRIFRNPPNSDEGLFDVAAALAGERAKSVKTPALRSGEKKNDSGDFGVVGWFVVLSSFVNPRTALAAVDGWGGDAYVGYTKGSQECVRIAFRGDTPKDTAEMTAALNEWRAAFTEGTVQVTGGGDRVELDACEPETVPVPRPESASALQLPVSRLALLNELLGSGVDRRLADCVTDNFIAVVPLEILDGESEAEQRQIFSLVERTARDCRAGGLS